MKPLINRLFGRAGEAKVSRTAPLVALAGAGRAVWSSRETGALTAAAFARNAIAYRCVKMISEGAASVHFDVFEGGNELDHHPIGRLLSRPNPRQAGPDFLEATFVNLLCFGNAYLELVADGRTPRELYTLRPDRVKVHPGPDGWPEAYEYSANGGSVLLRAEGDMPSVLHLKMFDPLDDYYGMAPLAAAHVAVDIHNAASNWNKALLDNSARPSGALVYATGGENMTDEAFSRLKEELETTFSGAFNAGRPILLEGGLDWKPLAMTPKDMDFMEAKSAAAREIALALGVPPLLLGLPGDNTYANFAEANRALWRQTILPLVERTLKAIVHWLEPAYGPGLTLNIDYDRIEALSSERDALWKRLEAASFLERSEKRTAAGYKNTPATTPLAPDGGSGRAAAPLGKGGQGGKPNSPFDFLGALTPPRAKFDPDQLRDEQGRWTSGGGGGETPDGTAIRLIGFDRDDYVNDHIQQRHVGKSDEWLIDQVNREQYRGWFTSAGRDRLGSFDSVENARDLIRTTLDANSIEVSQVASGAVTDIVFITQRFGFETGREAVKDHPTTDPRIRTTYMVGVVIEHDKTYSRGYRIISAYPRNYNDRIGR